MGNSKYRGFRNLRRIANKLGVRHRWVRVVLVGVAMGLLSYSFTQGADAFLVRKKLVEAIPSISLLFAVTSALLMMIMSNSVFGLRDQVREQARRVFSRAWQLHDEFAESGNVAIQKLIDEHVSTLLCLPFDEYQNPENYQGWSEGIKPVLDAVRETSNANRIMYRYLLPLENELNTLGILFVRRLIVDVHLSTLVESFALVVIAICVAVLGNLLPFSPVGDIALANAALGVLVLAPLQLLVVLSYLRQEAREESMNEILNEDEDGPCDS